MALLANEKASRLHTLGRWRKLINGLLAKSAVDPRTKSLQLCAKWRRLANMLLAKEGKQRSLRVLGRWRKLVTAWQRSDQ